MFRFSIVIPLCGSTSQFDETLASALLNRPANSQIIVVHNGDYRDPYGLEKEVDFVVAAGDEPSENLDESGQPNLIKMFNAGVRAARGRWIAFFRPGIRLSEDWDASVESGFADPEVAAISPVIVRSEDPQQLCALGVATGYGFSRRVVGFRGSLSATNRQQPTIDGPTFWAAFYRRSILNAIGDVDSTLDPVYWDLDLALSLGSIDLKTVLAVDCQVLLDDVAQFEAEIGKSHGCSAQRGFIRFGNLAPNDDADRQTMASTVKWSLVYGLANFFRKPQYLFHAWNRRHAAQYVETDQVYAELLKILHRQRDRLIAPGLHYQIATQQAKRPTVRRNAA